MRVHGKLTPLSVWLVVLAHMWGKRRKNSWQGMICKEQFCDELDGKN